MRSPLVTTSFITGGDSNTGSTSSLDGDQHAEDEEEEDEEEEGRRG